MAKIIKIAVNGARKIIESAQGLAVEPAPWQERPVSGEKREPAPAATGKNS